MILGSSARQARPPAERKEITDRPQKLSLRRQAESLGISRGSPYHAPRPVSDAARKLMHRIDELHMDYPFAASRMMTGLLRQEGVTAGRLHVTTCMEMMGIGTDRNLRPCSTLFQVRLG
ncbi:hypothetical protein [Roseovarius sp. SYSU LYC5161]|uniref:hypothetical protein n=1 Tax=Roseovarius halophilus (ex Wu et al. 2025) TaxID=3376060 RepID=UPI00399B9D56